MNKFGKSVLKLTSFGKRPRLLAGVVLVLLALAAGGVAWHSSVHAATSSNIVILSYDHTERTVPTQAKTVGELLRELDIKVNQGDVVEPAPTSRINQDRFRINIYRAVPIIIIDGTHKTYTFSAAASPRAVTEQAGLKVYAEDGLTEGPVTNFARDNAIGEQIVVDRATPVNLVLYGHASTVRTQAKTVGDLVNEKHIKLASGDTLRPSADTPLTSGLTVAVAHHGVEFTTVTEPIPAPVRYVYDANLTIGTGAIRQKGSDGQQEVTYKVVTKNGQEVSRQAIQTVVISKPVEEIIARGTAAGGDISTVHQQWMSDAGISPGDQSYADYIISRESGWNSFSVNSRSGACGLAQEYPCGKSGCNLGDAICELRWVNGYVQRYGGWAGAASHWAAVGSY